MEPSSVRVFSTAAEEDVFEMSLSVPLTATTSLPSTMSGPLTLAQVLPSSLRSIIQDAVVGTDDVGAVVTLPPASVSGHSEAVSGAVTPPETGLSESSEREAFHAE